VSDCSPGRRSAALSFELFRWGLPTATAPLVGRGEMDPALTFSTTQEQWVSGRGFPAACRDPKPKGPKRTEKMSFLPV